MKTTLHSVVAASSKLGHRTLPEAAAGAPHPPATPKEQHFVGFSQCKRWLSRFGHRLRWGGFNMVAPHALRASVACARVNPGWA